MINYDEEYYTSQGDYTPRKWDNPMLCVDSMLKMVAVPDTAMIIPDEDVNMLAYDNTAESVVGFTRGSRRGNITLTRGSRREDIGVN